MSEEYAEAYCAKCNTVRTWHIFNGNLHCDGCGLSSGHAGEPVPTGGAKDTAGKPRYSLLPRKGCLAVIEAREYGARKYGSDKNWVKVSQRDWIEATLRHLYAFLDGEVKDPESGLDHLSHAACSAFLAASVKPEGSQTP